MTDPSNPHAPRPDPETAEFHRSRRMWAVVHGTLLLAGREDPRSHYEWLASLLGDEQCREAFATSTRGYIRDGVMAAYKPCAGDDFSRWVDKDSMIIAYGVLGGAFNITEFWLGVRNPGTVGTQWEPVCRVDEDKLALYLDRT